MQFVQYHKEGIYQYIYLPIHNYTEDNYTNQLFQHHKVPGFMNYEIRTIDDSQYIYYLLRYRTTLQVIAESRNFQKDLLLQLLRSIIHIIEITQEYLLDYNFIIWSMDCIFVDVETGNVLFCYYPGNLEGSDLKDFLTKLIQCIGKKKEELSIMTIQFYNCITDPNCSMEALRKFEKEYIPNQNTEGADMLVEDNESAERVPDQHNEKEVTGEKETIFRVIMNIIIFALGIANVVIIFLFIFQILSFDYVHILLILSVIFIVAIIINLISVKEESPDEMMEAYLREENIQEKKEKTPEGEKKVIYGETGILSEYPLEQLVVEEDTKVLVLIPARRENYKPIRILDKSVVIGCMAENCDYVLSDRGISRLHAKLILHNQKLYLLDLNSTNGTFLNGEQILCGKEYLLEEGDVVTFCQTEFYVVTENGNPQAF